MTSNQTMDYYVRPQHIYLHSRTCTHSGWCRRPSSLVEFHICYLLDHASVHEISALVTWFQCMLDIFSHYGDLDPWYIFRFHGDLGPLYIFIMEILIYYILYVAMTTHVIFCIMPIHGHCTLIYPRLLYVLAVMCRVWLLYYIVGWLVLPSGSSSLHFWDGIIMYFSHCMTPLNSHIRGHLL